MRLKAVRYPHVWDDPQLIAGRLVHYTYGTPDSINDVLNRLEAICDDNPLNPGYPGPLVAQYTYLGRCHCGLQPRAGAALRPHHDAGSLAVCP